MCDRKTTIAPEILFVPASIEPVELNGQPRSLKVNDKSVAHEHVKRERADPSARELPASATLTLSTDNATATVEIVLR